MLCLLYPIFLTHLLESSSQRDSTTAPSGKHSTLCQGHTAKGHSGLIWGSKLGDLIQVFSWDLHMLIRNPKSNTVSKWTGRCLITRTKNVFLKRKNCKLPKVIPTPEFPHHQKVPKSSIPKNNRKITQTAFLNFPSSSFVKHMPTRFCGLPQNFSSYFQGNNLKLHVFLVFFLRAELHSDPLKIFIIMYYLPYM